MLDKVLDLFTASFAKGLDATEIGGIHLDQDGIELVLANDLAETITEPSSPG